MLNSSLLVGRIVKTPELRETSNGTKVSNITLAVPRPFKNVNGEYDTDFIECTLWTGIAQKAVDYCKKGDLVGVKGRLQTSTIEKEDTPKMTVLQFIVENLSFLHSTNNKEEKHTEKDNE